MLGRRASCELSSVQVIVESVAVRLIFPVKFWSCSIGGPCVPDGGMQDQGLKDLLSHPPFAEWYRYSPGQGSAMPVMAPMVLFFG